MSRCALTQDQQGLVLQASDGVLHLLDTHSGEVISLPPDGVETFETLVAGSGWLRSEIVYRTKDHRVVLAHDEQRQVNLGALGLQYIDPASAPDHFIAFNRSKSTFQRMSISTGEVIWTHPFAFAGQFRRSDARDQVLSPNRSWNLMTQEADNRQPRNLLLIDDPVILKAAGLGTADAEKPHAVFLDPLMPTTRSGIRQLVQVPGTPRFLMRVNDGYNENFVRFTLQLSGGDVGFTAEPPAPRKTCLIQHAYGLGACAAEGASAATRDKPVSCGTTVCAQGATLGLSVAPHDPRFSRVSLRRLLPRRLLGAIAFGTYHNTTWRPLDSQRQAPPSSGFSVVWGGDWLVPSPSVANEGQLELRRPGHGDLPWVTDFGDRSFVHDRTCVAPSTQGDLVAISLGNVINVLSRASVNGVEAVRTERIDLPVDAQAALERTTPR